jgi:DNA polymerase bacteriophage-type
MSVPIVSLDFELASTLELAAVGSDVWTRCPDTVPILAGFAIDYDAPVRLRPVCLEFDNIDHVYQQTLLHAVDAGAEIHAWNANFEFQVWNNICVPRFNWPPLPIERFHCTMAAAACAGLPLNLDEASQAVVSPFTKDKAGHAVMLRMARPRRYDAQGKPIWWHREDPAKLRQLIAYNLMDVQAEREVCLRIPRLSARERQIWLTDQRMNQRGLPVDKPLIRALDQITQQELDRLNAEIACLTQGEVTSATQNLKLLVWVQNQGYPHQTLERQTLTAFVASPAFRQVSQLGQEVLTLRLEASKTSTAKLRSISQYTQLGDHARNLVQYGGAVRTLRWAGRGPQIQNFPRPVVKHIKQAIEQILQGMNADGLRLLFGNPLDVVSSCLRGVFKALEGFSFVICDYHAIEAVVVAWLADFEAVLDAFRRHEDIYIFTANGIGSTDRMLGKVLRLAAGFGIGWHKFQETAASYGLLLADTEAKTAVELFRLANRPIVEFWHGCEASAEKAIQNPGSTFVFKKVKYRMANPNGRLAGALLCQLPSGRYLVYRNARLEQGRIIFWGVNQYTRHWQELDTYGGKLVENITQAVARDLLADTLVYLEGEFPGALLTTVHDEIIAMTRDEDADELFQGMKTAMSTPPPWGMGLPLSSAGSISERYGKL